MATFQSRKCVYCELNWPHVEEYGVCPQCREPTTNSYAEATMTEEDAKSLAAHSQFGWHLYDAGKL